MNSNKSKTLRFLSFFLTLSMLFALLCGCSSEENTVETQPDTTAVSQIEYRVSVLQSDTTKDGNEAYEGFVSALSDNGYVFDENIEVNLVTVADADSANASAQDIVKASPDLILAIGEEAAKASVAATDTIPVVFACINDPIDAGLLTSCETPDKNATGVSDFVPVYKQLEFAKTLVPDAKNLTSIYCTTDENSILISSLISAEASELSLKYTAYTASTERELSSTLKSALKECDVLYVPADTLTTALFSDIVKAANKKNIPIITSDTALVYEGALATSVHDYAEVGYEAGEMALVLLKGLKPISSMPVVYPQICKNVVNSKTLETLKLEISEDVGDVIMVE